MKHRVTEWGLALHDRLKSARCLGAESSVDTPIPEAKALAASATDRFWIRAKLRLPGALPPGLRAQESSHTLQIQRRPR
jgi:hypothetical protein